MSSAPSDRNLLFGVLAQQMDFIDRDALIAALHAWVLDKAKPLGRILLDQMRLTTEEHDLIEALVRKHLDKHDGDLQKSLAAIQLPGTTHHQLQQIADADLGVSLAQIPFAIPIEDDPGATRDFSMGTPSSSGLRFRILRPHAKGGLGEVFVARDTELHREVALKEIQDCYADNPSSRSRFLLEAEITGALEHPGIVPVYGLGQYAGGRPFYAMRFIQGESLWDAIVRHHQTSATNSEAHSLEFERRALLTRFIAVCNAVAYAHSRGVIHRDIKPANIMLGKYGETLVVDWGMAKAGMKERDPSASNGLREPTLAPTFADANETQDGSAVGTPAYMSPEQAAGLLELIGPATDIYSLGATLYTVLTGRPPIEGKDTEDILRKAQRGEWLPPRQVKSNVPPALDAICRKAMTALPSARYSTALELAADVEHWLADEPVSAHREPWGTRSRRWMRRYRTLVSTLVSILVIALLCATLGLVLISDAWEKEATARGLAQEKEGEAQKEKVAALASQKQAMEALRTTTDDVVEQLIGGKLVLGPAEKAFLEATLKRWQAFADAAGEGQQARSIRAEGVYRMAKLLAKLGQRDEAMIGYREAIALRQKLMDDFPGVPQHRQDLALTYAQLGQVLADLGKQQERETVLRQALALREELAADFPDEPEYRFDEAISRHDLGWLLHTQRKYTEAESSYRRALALYDQLTTASPAVAKYRWNMAHTQKYLGQLLVEQRKFEAAEAAHGQAIALLEKLVDEFPAAPDYRDRLAESYDALGARFNHQARNPREAVAFHRAALAIQEKLVADFPAVPDYRNNLALYYNNLGATLRQNRNQETETVLRQGLAIAEKLVAEFPTVPDYRNVLGLIQANLGSTFTDISKEPEKALPWLDKAIATLEEALRRGGSMASIGYELKAAHNYRAEALDTLQRHAEALKDYDKMVELATEADRPLLRSLRAVGQVRAGQAAAAITEAGELAKSADSGVLYNAACIYALASKPTKANPISPELQAKCAERAVALLRQAVAKGYNNVHEMKNDEDLKSLRPRDDFQKLLHEMEK